MPHLFENDPFSTISDKNFILPLKLCVKTFNNIQLMLASSQQREIVETRDIYCWAKQSQEQQYLSRLQQFLKLGETHCACFSH